MSRGMSIESSIARPPGRRDSIAWWIVIALGCAPGRKRSPATTASTATAAAARATPPETYPAGFDRGKYAGSAACADCHAENYAAWAASPHGRASHLASPSLMLGDFSAEPLAVQGGTVA